VFGACSPGDQVLPDAPLNGDPTCIPDDIDESVPPASPTASRYGKSLAWVRYSGLVHNNVTNVFSQMAAGGAPGTSCSGSPCGYVRGEKVDPGSGELTSEVYDFGAASAGTSKVVVSGTGRFGSALAGVDLVSHYHDPDRSGPKDFVGGGDEILVGDPDPVSGAGDDTGRIHWFFSEYSGSISDQGQAAAFDKYAWFEGGSFRPAGMASGAEFGAAVAARSSVYGTPTSAVAVGAPGQNTVYTLAVASGWTGTSGTPDGVVNTATPFSDTGSTLDELIVSDLTDCTPAGAVSRFGDELLYHDLNGDAVPELIIGAPADSTGTKRGHVFVLKGVSTFPYYTPNGCLVLTNTNGGNDDEFGASLAAGAIMVDAAHRHLVIGSPGEVSGSIADAGGVCFVALGDDTSGGDLQLDTGLYANGVRCKSNPFPLTSGDVQRFGEAVAVGNYAPLDRTGQNSGKWAEIEEVAVGTPGGRQVEIQGVSGTGVTTYEYQNVSSPVAYGTVTVFRSTEDGPKVFQPVGTGGAPKDHQDLAQVVDATAAAGYGFGGALLTANLENNTSPDLIIGAPTAVPTGRSAADGSFFVTRSSAGNGLNSGLSGNYDVTDIGSSKTARLLDFGAEGVSVAIEGFEMEVRDTSEAPCTLDENADNIPEFNGEATFDLYTSPADLAGTSPTNKLTVPLEVPAAAVGGIQDMTVTVDLWIESGSGGPNTVIKYELFEPMVDGDDPWPTRDCTPRISPNELDFSNYQVCE
jgi:hypothetical protein